MYFYTLIEYQKSKENNICSCLLIVKNSTFYYKWLCHSSEANTNYWYLYTREILMYDNKDTAAFL